MKVVKLSVNKENKEAGVFANAEPSWGVQQFALVVLALHEPCGESVVPKPLT